LLGKNTASGVIPAAILFGALDQGGRLMQANASVDPNIISIIQGLIILFVGAEYLVRFLAARTGTGIWAGIRLTLGRTLEAPGGPGSPPEESAT